MSENEQNPQPKPTSLSTNTPKQFATTHLIIVLITQASIYIGVMFLLLAYGVIPSLGYATLLVSCVTVFGILLKTLFGFFISEEIDYAKQGYDFCTLALGASLSHLSLQVSSDDDLSKDLRSMIGLPVSVVPEEAKRESFIFLVAIFLISILVTFLVVIFARASKQQGRKVPIIPRILAFVLGAVLFGTYVFFVLTKG